jgi:CheY-like chemotaxis protein
MRILLIEDDPGLGNAVRDQLAAEGHMPDLAPTLSYARDLLATMPYDLILLDLGLPDGRGIDFLKALRAKGSVTPVMILTAHDRITERIEGLNAGADDYMVKPFDLAELSARIAAVARRYAGNPNPLITLGALKIDLAAHAIHGHPEAVGVVDRLVLIGSAQAPLQPSQWIEHQRLQHRVGHVAGHAGGGASHIASSVGGGAGGRSGAIHQAGYRRVAAIPDHQPADGPAGLGALFRSLRRQRRQRCVGTNNRCREL